MTTSANNREWDLPIENPSSSSLALSNTNKHNNHGREGTASKQPLPLREKVTMMHQNTTLNPQPCSNTANTSTNTSQQMKLMKTQQQNASPSLSRSHSHPNDDNNHSKVNTNNTTTYQQTNSNTSTNTVSESTEFIQYQNHVIQMLTQIQSTSFETEQKSITSQTLSNKDDKIGVLRSDVCTLREDGDVVKRIFEGEKLKYVNEIERLNVLLTNSTDTNTKLTGTIEILTEEVKKLKGDAVDFKVKEDVRSVEGKEKEKRDAVKWEQEAYLLRKTLVRK